MTTQTQTKSVINKEDQILRQFLDKVVINVGVGRTSQLQNFEDKILPEIRKDVASIAGQSAQVCRAKKSIAGFKIREGQIVGVRTTLRGQKMVDFFNRLVKIVLPRVRDFAGLDLKNIDQGGVLNIGLREHLVFPEINPDTTQHYFSLQVTIVPKSKDRKAALEMYRTLGVPLKK
ncbi:MAG: 50S ribosomal protein L5 [Anaplasmataceae bacterium]|nr:50S ribosomal protein L5 [Anaplasmataceae bacterium]